MNKETPPPLPPELRADAGQNHPEALQRMERVWNLLGHVLNDTGTAPTTDAAWEDILQRIEPIPQAKPHQTQRKDRQPILRNRPSRTGIMAAIALAAALVIGMVIWSRAVTVAAPYGTQKTLTLPDGSIAELNSGSRIRYTRLFQKWPLIPAAQRTVILEGEAFFTVVPEGRPFAVQTFNARIEVMGTRFNVRARRDTGAGETRVLLASGKVRVAAHGAASDSIILSGKGQSALVTSLASGPELMPERIDNVAHILAWRQKGFAVQDQPLSSILSEIERRYNVSVQLANGVVSTDSLTLWYGDGTTAEQILHDICFAENLRYRRTSTGYLLYSPAN